MPPKNKFKKKEWSANHQKKFLWLYNYVKQNNYPDAKQEDFIDIHKKYLMGIIQNNKSWSDGSKEGLLFMISRYLYNAEETRYQKNICTSWTRSNS